MIVFILALLFFCFSHFLASQRFSIITSNIVDSKRKMSVGYINYFSILFSNLIPFGPTADLCRITMLNTQHNVKLSNCLIISIADRIISFIVVSFVGISFLLIQFLIESNLKRHIFSYIFLVSINIDFNYNNFFIKDKNYKTHKLFEI